MKGSKALRDRMERRRSRVRYACQGFGRGGWRGGWEGVVMVFVAMVGEREERGASWACIDR